MFVTCFPTFLERCSPGVQGSCWMAELRTWCSFKKKREMNLIAMKDEGVESVHLVNNWGSMTFS